MRKFITILAAVISVCACRGQTRQEVVAAVLIGEAGGEGRQGMEAVFEVIYQRSQERKFSSYKVVTQKRQFSCLNQVSPSRLVQIAKRHPRWRTALELSGYAKPKTSWTKGANHYHAKSIDPGWPNEVARVGNHIFYRF